MFFLDSDTFTAFLHGHALVVSRIQLHPPQNVAVSVLMAEELISGQMAEIRRFKNNPVKLQRGYAFLITVLSALCRFSIQLYTEEAETRFAAFDPKSKRIGPVDCKLIAHALTAKAMIVTNNTADFEAIRDFEGLAELAIVNWMLP